MHCKFEIRTVSAAIHLSVIRLFSIVRVLKVLIVMLFTYRLLSMYDNPSLQLRFHSEAVVCDTESIIIDCHYTFINIK